SDRRRKLFDQRVDDLARDRSEIVDRLSDNFDFVFVEELENARGKVAVERQNDGSRLHGTGKRPDSGRHRGRSCQASTSTTGDPNRKSRRIAWPILSAHGRSGAEIEAKE